MRGENVERSIVRDFYALQTLVNECIVYDMNLCNNAVCCLLVLVYLNPLNEAASRSSWCNRCSSRNRRYSCG